jgi:hypothetical protein
MTARAWVKAQDIKADYRIHAKEFPNQYPLGQTVDNQKI